MNIAVILNHFPYFLAFAGKDRENVFYFCSARRKFLIKGKDVVEVCTVDLMAKGAERPLGDVDEYFAPGRVIGAVPAKTDLSAISARYENWFLRFLDRHKIDCLVSGATTGFERIGLRIARGIGVKTFCVWEGLFRPGTISLDPKGMNAESAFAAKPFSEIRSHKSSEQFASFYSGFQTYLRTSSVAPRSLRSIQGGRFDVWRQLRNRLSEAADFERVRLPLSAHLNARISYYRQRHHYVDFNAVHRPFILFPLQSHTDINVVLHGGLFPFRGIVNLVRSAFKQVRQHMDCILLIKEHPMDVFRSPYDRRPGSSIYWINPVVPIATILNHPRCLGTVVVNSTSGLESLILGKPVLCLGKALYNHPELVRAPLSMTVHGLVDALHSLVTDRVDSVAVDQFSGCLYDTMQVPGDIERIPTGDEIDLFIAILNRRNNGAEN